MHAVKTLETLLHEILMAKIRVSPDYVLDLPHPTPAQA